MAAYDITRPYAAAGSAAGIGSIFTSAFGSLDATRANAAEGPAAGIGKLVASAFGAFAAWNDARLTRNSLAALTDRELDDIGLHRGDIDNVAYR